MGIKRNIVLDTFPCADGTWGVCFKQTGSIESKGYATLHDAEQHVLSKQPGKFAKFVLFDRSGDCYACNRPRIEHTGGMSR